MKNLALCCLVALSLACGGTVAPAAEASSPPPSASPLVAAASCAGTVISQGAVPAWVDVAGGHNNPIGVPFAIDNAQTVAAYLWGNPLRAGHPENPSNKIMFVVRAPREGSDLTINAHPLGAPTPAVKVVQPANSGPGEIYPSVVDVPTAGCWVLDLSWGSHKATLDLAYA